MHATDPGPVRVCLARYEYADDVLEVWGTVRSAAGAPPEPELLYACTRRLHYSIHKLLNLSLRGIVL
jgi:hypothetical protein